MVSAPGGFALLVPGLPFTFQVAFSRSLTRLSFLTSKVGIISRSPSWLSKDVKALSKSVASRAIHSFQKHLHKIYGKLSPRNEAGREWKFEILHWREGGIVCRKGRIVNIRGLVGFRRDSSMRPKAAKTTVQGLAVAVSPKCIYGNRSGSHGPEFAKLLQPPRPVLSPQSSHRHPKVKDLPERGPRPGNQ